VASHDLQEPLRMVASYTQLLEKRYKDKLDADAKDFIGFAVDGALRMQQLINDLLQYSRVGSQIKGFEPTPMGEVFDWALRNLDTAVRESGATVTRGELPVIQGDAGQLLHLFQNLIANGIKFRGQAAPQVEVTAEERPEEWVFRVRDNGIGIEPEFFDRIFVIFQRLHTRDKYPGTGIGLALCKKIVERHGGRIWVESTKGQGATFVFVLPKNPPEEMK
jgi:hypothetical protein